MLDKRVASLQRVVEALAESSTATGAAALDSQVPWLLQCMKQWNLKFYSNNICGIYSRYSDVEKYLVEPGETVAAAG